MYKGGFMKGVGMGLVVGAALAAAVIPVDKRKVMKSPAGRVIRTIGHAVDSLT